MSSEKKSPAKRPYWNFWRAVLAGWLIRYPGFFWGCIRNALILSAILICALIHPFFVEESRTVEDSRSNGEKLR
jgi:hypothetical protein